jgi:hypothetical protein
MKVNQVPLIEYKMKLYKINNIKMNKIIKINPLINHNQILKIYIKYFRKINLI